MEGPGYWDYATSHNVSFIAGKGQLIEAIAKALSTKLGDNPEIRIDLTSAYSDRAESVLRRVGLIENRTRLRVVDGFVLKAATPILGGMTPDAEIEFRPDGSALLTRKGRQLVARIVVPAGAKFTSSSAEQKAPENPNKGIRRLELSASAPIGEFVIEIELAAAKKP